MTETDKKNIQVLGLIEDILEGTFLPMEEEKNRRRFDILLFKLNNQYWNEEESILEYTLYLLKKYNISFEWQKKSTLAKAIKKLYSILLPKYRYALLEYLLNQEYQFFLEYNPFLAKNGVTLQKFLNELPTFSEENPKYKTKFSFFKTKQILKEYCFFIDESGKLNQAFRECIKNHIKKMPLESDFLDDWKYLCFDDKIEAYIRKTIEDMYYLIHEFIHFYIDQSKEKDISSTYYTYSETPSIFFETYLNEFLKEKKEEIYNLEDRVLCNKKKDSDKGWSGFSKCLNAIFLSFSKEGKWDLSQINEETCDLYNEWLLSGNIGEAQEFYNYSFAYLVTKRLIKRAQEGKTDFLEKMKNMLESLPNTLMDPLYFLYEFQLYDLAYLLKPISKAYYKIPIEDQTLKRKKEENERIDRK